jgi:hypothetical protein
VYFQETKINEVQKNEPCFLFGLIKDLHVGEYFPSLFFNKLVSQNKSFATLGTVAAKKS